MEGVDLSALQAELLAKRETLLNELGMAVDAAHAAAEPLTKAALASRRRKSAALEDATNPVDGGERRRSLRVKGLSSDGTALPASFREPAAGGGGSGSGGERRNALEGDVPWQDSLLRPSSAATAAPVLDAVRAATARLLRLPQPPPIIAPTPVLLPAVAAAPQTETPVATEISPALRGRTRAAMARASPAITTIASGVVTPAASTPVASAAADGGLLATFDADAGFALPIPVVGEAPRKLAGSVSRGRAGLGESGTGGSGTALSGLSLRDVTAVLKVVPDRIYSVCLHPAADKVLALTGSKAGFVAIWEPVMDKLEPPSVATSNGSARSQEPSSKRARLDDSKVSATTSQAARKSSGDDDGGSDGSGDGDAGEDDDDGPGARVRVGARVREAMRRGPTSADADDFDEDTPEDRVALFSPHSAPINQLLVPRGAPHLVVSCSYDGTVRSLDLNKGMSWAWLRSSSDGGGRSRDAGVSAIDVLAGSVSPGAGGAGVTGATAVGLYDGGLGLLDTRAGALVNLVAEAHGRKVTSISSAGAHHFTSSSSDSTVCLWDARALRSKPLASASSEQAITSAFVSPSATHAVATCNDNKLRIFALDWTLPAKPSLRQTAAIFHNNHTGRWLSAIRAVFDPADDGVFVCGSMDREVEIYEASGRRLAALTSEWLTAVPTLNCVHPTRRIILSGTASGRLHLWT